MGAGRDHMAPEGSPTGRAVLSPGWWLGPPGSCAFHRQMPGPPSPHGAQKERGLTLLEAAVAELSAGRAWLEWGSGRAIPPTALELFEDSWHSSPPSKSLPSFPGCLLTKARVALGTGKVREGIVACAGEILSSGHWRACLGPPSTSAHTGHCTGAASA